MSSASPWSTFRLGELNSARLSSQLPAHLMSLEQAAVGPGPVSAGEEL